MSDTEGLEAAPPRYTAAIACDQSPSQVVAGRGGGGGGHPPRIIDGRDDPGDGDPDDRDPGGEDGRLSVDQWADRADPTQLLRRLADRARRDGRYLGAGAQSETHWLRLHASVLLEAGWDHGAIDGSHPMASEELEVVVKIPAHARRASGARRLAREAKILGQLRSAGVTGVPVLWMPRVEEVGDAVALHAMAISYLPGLQLEEALKNEWKHELRSGGDVLQLAAQAWCRLRACRAAGVAHRDFGAHNVLVGQRPDGTPNTGMVSLFDFGYAFAVAAPLLDHNGRPMASNSRGVLPGHMAPEQGVGWEGDPLQQHKRGYIHPSVFEDQWPIDVYQWGCFVLHIALRELPEDLATALTTATHRDQRHADLDRAVNGLLHRAELPEPLGVAVRMALAFVPGDRDPVAIEECLAVVTEPDRILSQWAAAQAAERSAAGHEETRRTLVAAHAEAEANIKDLRRELQQATDVAEQLPALRADVARLERALKTTEDARQRLETRATAAGDELQGLRKRQLEKDSRAATDLQRAMSEHAQAKSALDAANAQLRRQAEEAKQAQAEAARASAKTARLEQDLLLARRASSPSAEGDEVGREGLWGAVAVLACLLLVAVGGLAVLGNEFAARGDEITSLKRSETASQNTPTSQPKATSTTTIFRSAETALLAHIPSSIERSSCDAASKYTGYDNVTHVHCKGQSGVDIYYYQFDNVQLLDQAFQNRNGQLQAGVCDPGQGSQFNVTATWEYTGTPGVTQGKMSCWTGSDGSVFIEWTHTQARIFSLMRLDAGRSQSDQKAAIWSAWRNAGPSA